MVILSKKRCLQEKENIALLYIPYGTQSRAMVSPHFSKQHKQKGHREKGGTMHRRTANKTEEMRHTQISVLLPERITYKESKGNMLSALDIYYSIWKTCLLWPLSPANTPRLGWWRYKSQHNLILLFQSSLHDYFVGGYVTSAHPGMKWAKARGALEILFDIWRTEHTQLLRGHRTIQVWLTYY